MSSEILHEMWNSARNVKFCIASEILREKQNSIWNVKFCISIEILHGKWNSARNVKSCIARQILREIQNSVRLVTFFISIEILNGRWNSTRNVNFYTQGEILHRKWNFTQNTLLLYRTAWISPETSCTAKGLDTAWEKARERLNRVVTRADVPSRKSLCCALQSLHTMCLLLMPFLGCARVGVRGSEEILTKGLVGVGWIFSKRRL